MQVPKLRLIRWAIVLLVTYQAVFAALPTLAQGNSRASSHSADARDRMELTLVGESNAPYHAQLFFSATPSLNAPAVQVTWSVDPAQLLDGPADETLGEYAAGSTIQQAHTVQFPHAGAYRLSVLVTYQPYAGAQFGGSGLLYAQVDGAGVVTLTNYEPNLPPLQHSIVQMAETQEASSAGVERVNGDPCYNISGNIMRNDFLNTSTGRNATPTQVPVRNALVEMREDDIVFDDSYGEVLTDANGNFTFPRFCDDDGVFDDEMEFYVRIRAELRDGGFTVVEVEDTSWIDEVYEFDSVQQVDDDGGNLTFNLLMTGDQAAVMNIADAVLDAYNFWNFSGGASGDDAKFGQSAEVHWERGYGEGTSHYFGTIFDEMTIADSPDPDEWDDSVIMHEWGHMADDVYGCDDTPGGQHSFGQVLDPELAWGEAYPDYWQSAVRTWLSVNSANFYIDNDANGNTRIAQNLEMLGSAADARIEDSVAAMLWDLSDSTNDGQDTVSYGHTSLQKLYTDPVFESNGNIFDDDCTANVYLKSWRDFAYPTDGVTAATVTQNVGIANPFAAQSADVGTAQVASVQSPSAVNAAATADDYVWWKKVTMVADNSPSMAGAKFDAVKKVIKEQVDNYDDDPKGVEVNLYTFNNVLPGTQELARGRFFASALNPIVDSMSTRSAGEAGEICSVDSFGALRQVIGDKRNGEVWLYTDGDADAYQADPETMAQLLTARGLKASFVQLGLCAPAATPDPDTQGTTYNFLGKAAGGQSSGIVPYLLTALASGGNYLFVSDSQLADASAVLMAQFNHTAGAGKWSDYVSNDYTYRWDRLTPWEYNWVDPPTFRGRAVDDNYVLIGTPILTTWGSTHDQLRVYGNGYIEMGPEPTFSFHPPENALNILKATPPLDWGESGPAAAAASPDATDETRQTIFSDMDPTGQWYVVSTTGYNDASQARGYEALFNPTTHEIRYQYKDVPAGDSSKSLISISWFDYDAFFGDEVAIANGDGNAAAPGLGYKFVEAPPQPTKTYNVNVDSEMSGIGFLLTGYSGNVDFFSFKDPDGNLLSCDEAGAICKNLGLVEYFQFNVNGRFGNWEVVVGGNGTFSFNAMAASAVAVQSTYDHQLPWGEPSLLRIKLGAAAVDNQLNAFFTRPDGSLMGPAVTLLDDGTQGDERAGDGLFGLTGFTPPAQGVGYLHVHGTVDGTELERVDPVPYNFQPFQFTGPATVDYYGQGGVILTYTITNHSDTSYCFGVQSKLPEDWLFEWELLPQDVFGICVAAGEQTIRRVTITPPSLDDPAPSGSLGEISFTLSERQRGMVVDSVTTTLMRRRLPTFIAIDNNYSSSYLRPNGRDTAQLIAGAYDSQGVPAPDDTQIKLVASTGSISLSVASLISSDPLIGTTINGQLPFSYTSGTVAGDAVITATIFGTSVQTTTVMHIQKAMADPGQLTFKVTPADLRNAESANLLVTVHDQWGNRVRGQTVRFAVGDDGASGEIAEAQVSEAGEVAAADLSSPAAIDATNAVTLTTNNQGQAAATFIKAEDAVGVGGYVVVAVQLLFNQGHGLEVVAEARQKIRIADVVDEPEPTGPDNFLYLPSLSRRGK